MLPGGNSHWIADKPGSKVVPSKRVAEACELDDPLFQQGEITNCLMCGLVHYDNEASHPILDSLPDILHFPKLNPVKPIWTIVALIDTEMRRTQCQGSTIVNRLTEVLFLQLLNHYVKESKNATGFLAAIRDRRVHCALTLIHREPNFGWSLSSLGQRVGMSRATLVRHFQDAVGIAPMTYIMRWRIMKAYNLIKYTSTPMQPIAESVGFTSARTLSKAFQRHYGRTPNELRQAQGTR